MENENKRKFYIWTIQLQIFGIRTFHCSIAEHISDLNKFAELERRRVQVEIAKAAKGKYTPLPEIVCVTRGEMIR